MITTLKDNKQFKQCETEQKSEKSILLDISNDINNALKNQEFTIKGYIIDKKLDQINIKTIINVIMDNTNNLTSIPNDKQKLNFILYLIDYIELYDIEIILNDDLEKKFNDIIEYKNNYYNPNSSIQQEEEQNIISIEENKKTIKRTKLKYENNI